VSVLINFVEHSQPASHYTIVMNANAHFNSTQNDTVPVHSNRAVSIGLNSCVEPKSQLSDDNQMEQDKPVSTRPGMFLTAVGATLAPGVRRTSFE